MRCSIQLNMNQTSIFPKRIVVIVPVHHDPSRSSTARTNRVDLLRDCLASIVYAREHCLLKGSKFREITIVAVDDYSPADPRPLLRPENHSAILWLSNRGIKGQAGALNYAMANIEADAFAFTDSDCVVAADWLQRIGEHYLTYPYHDGVAGPQWLFRPDGAHWARLLTSQEAALMRLLARSEINYDHATTTRIDCRNLSLRAGFSSRMTAKGSLFTSDGSVSVSGQASYALKRCTANDEATVGFSSSMHTFHHPVSSFLGQIATYYARGRWSAFDEIYASLYGNLMAAFVRRYAIRHFISAMLSKSVSVLYVWPVHLAFWAGIIARKCASRRNMRSRQTDTG